MKIPKKQIKKALSLNKVDAVKNNSIFDTKNRKYSNRPASPVAVSKLNRPKTDKGYN
jgi:hypothetical protein